MRAVARKECENVCPPSMSYGAPYSGPIFNLWYILLNTAFQKAQHEPDPFRIGIVRASQS